MQSTMIIIAWTIFERCAGKSVLLKVTNILAFRYFSIAATAANCGNVPIRGRSFQLKSKLVNVCSVPSGEQILFTFYSEKKELYVNLNHELFGWVIENLIKNAIDAMQKEGALKLEIAPIGKKVKICISDSGKGMHKSLFKQIFKPGLPQKKEVGDWVCHFLKELWKITTKEK